MEGCCFGIEKGVLHRKMVRDCNMLTLNKADFFTTLGYLEAGKTTLLLQRAGKCW